MKYCTLGKGLEVSTASPPPAAGPLGVGKLRRILCAIPATLRGISSSREREGYAHDGRTANEYMYNALRFFWN